MPEVVISDTSVLIIFHKIGELNLLKKVYHSLIITPEVAREFIEQLPEWIAVVSVKDNKYRNFIETQVDLGEASAIALAAEFDNPLLLLDDIKARKLAAKLDMNFTGTLGVIHKAKQIGVVDKVKPLIDKLLSTDFRISNNIVIELLKMNNEMPVTDKLE